MDDFEVIIYFYERLKPLKDEIVELKREIEELKREIEELKYFNSELCKLPDFHSENKK